MNSLPVRTKLSWRKTIFIYFKVQTKSPTHFPEIAYLISLINFPSYRPPPKHSAVTVKLGKYTSWWWVPGPRGTSESITVTGITVLYMIKYSFIRYGTKPSFYAFV